MTTEHELICRASCGDGEAFAQLIDPHRAELMRFARRMLGEDREAADEVLQEAMLSAYRALQQGSRPDALRAWLFAIVRNGALNILRCSRPTAPFADEEKLGGHRTAHDEAEQGEWIDWLMAAISELPLRQRHALVGREFEGRTHTELAASLGTSALAVKTLLHRARATLRRLRTESMLSAALFVKGRVAGVKASLGVLGQALFAASTTTLIVLVLPASGPGSARAEGHRKTGRSEQRTTWHPAPRNSTSPPSRQTAAEGGRAISRCIHGESTRGISMEGLLDAARSLSSAQSEYTDCGSVLQAAAIEAAGNHRRACPSAPRRTGMQGAARRRARGCLRPAHVHVYFEASSGGLISAPTARQTSLVTAPNTIVVFPGNGWSLVVLQWTGWGRTETTGLATSVEARCEPGCSNRPPRAAEADAYQRSPARIVLWDPTLRHGHRIYRCFRLADERTIPTMMSDCPGNDG